MFKPKTVAVITAGQGVQQVTLDPGEKVKVKDLLNQLDASDHWLCHADGRPIASQDNLYDLVNQGEKLYTTPPAIVG